MYTWVLRAHLFTTDGLFAHARFSGEIFVYMRCILYYLFTRWYTLYYYIHTSIKYIALCVPSIFARDFKSIVIVLRYDMMCRYASKNYQRYNTYICT